MEFIEMLLRLDQFNAEFNIPCGVTARTDKLVEEMCELLESQYESTIDHQKEECLDVLITAIQLCTAYGIHDPLHFAAMKLERTSEKYRRMK